MAIRAWAQLYRRAVCVESGWFAGYWGLHSTVGLGGLCRVGVLCWLSGPLLNCGAGQYVESRGGLLAIGACAQLWGWVVCAVSRSGLLAIMASVQLWCWPVCAKSEWFDGYQGLRSAVGLGRLLATGACTQLRGCPSLRGAV